MSADVLLVSLVCYCVYRGTAYAPMYCTTPMQHRASMMQVLRVMIHTTDPEMHRSTISWMWDPALWISGCTLMTCTHEVLAWWMLSLVCTTVVHHVCVLQCSTRPPLMRVCGLPELCPQCSSTGCAVGQYHDAHGRYHRSTNHTGSVMDALLLSMVSIKSVTIGLHS